MSSSTHHQELLKLIKAVDGVLETGQTPPKGLPVPSNDKEPNVAVANVTTKTNTIGQNN